MRRVRHAERAANARRSPWQRGGVARGRCCSPLVLHRREQGGRSQALLGGRSCCQKLTPSAKSIFLSSARRSPHPNLPSLPELPASIPRRWGGGCPGRRATPCISVRSSPLLLALPRLRFRSRWGAESRRGTECALIPRDPGAGGGFNIQNMDAFALTIGALVVGVMRSRKLSFLGLHLVPILQHHSLADRPYAH